MGFGTGYRITMCIIHRKILEIEMNELHTSFGTQKNISNVTYDRHQCGEGRTSNENGKNRKDMKDHHMSNVRQTNQPPSYNGK